MSSKATISGKRGSNTTKTIKHTEPLSTASTLNFFKIEDEVTRKLSGTNVEKETANQIVAIRSILSSSLGNFKKHELRDNLLCHAMKLRRLNRHSNFKSKLDKDRLAEARQKVDEYYLSLQNVTNEITHLRKNIDVCLEFQPADSTIELIDVADFYANAPEEVTKPDVTRSDHHELHLARLNYELSERKSMIANLHELEGRKSALLSDIRGKEQRLNQVRSKINSIKKATNPLLEVLGLKARHFDFGSNGKQQKRTTAEGVRPVQLRPIYTNEEVYREIFGTQSIELGCDGRIKLKEEMSTDTPYSNNVNGTEVEQQEGSSGNSSIPSANTTIFFEIEDLASETGKEHIYSNALACLGSIRSLIKAADYSCLSLVLLQSISLRRLNRRSHFRIKISCGILEKARTNVEKSAIELQNVMATVDYLKKFAESCLDYQSSYEADISVDLIPVEQFFAEVPTALSRPESTRNDAHQLYLARLKHELRTRKSLLEKAKELEQRKNSVLESIEETEKALARLDPRVETLKKTAKPLLDIVGLKSVMLSVHNKEVPFRPVFVSAETYAELFADKESDGAETRGEGTQMLNNGEEEEDKAIEELAMELDDEQQLMEI